MINEGAWQMSEHQKKIQFIPFDAPLDKLLGLVAPPFHPSERPFAQLAYIEKYVRGCGATSLLIEREYIDRDYMEDYSVFYSRCLQEHGNSCTRLHFFRLSAADTRKVFNDFISEASQGGANGKVVEWCRENYLGFSIIKPLKGCPVGRTVLKVFGKHSDLTVHREFSSCRNYRVHLFGLELVVMGLAFQQQDLGVSACATTALWSSLQKVQSKEDIASATPAHITKHATNFSLPFGRPMPSEGLTTNQMCLAVQSLNLSPSLIVAEGFEANARPIVRSACKSGFAPVLILKRVWLGTKGEGQVKDGASDDCHAVTVAGIKIRQPLEETMLCADADGCFRDAANDVEALYIHDDRIGAYLKAEFDTTGSPSATTIQVEREIEETTEKWILTHVLVPMYPKIRLSFGDLHYVARKHLADRIVPILKLAFGDEKVPVAKLDVWIEKGHEYFQTISEYQGVVTLEPMLRLCESIRLPKYVGIIRIEVPFYGNFDVLVDTTSTLNNLHFIGIVDLSPDSWTENPIGQALEQACKCPIVRLHEVRDQDACSAA